MPSLPRDEHRRGSGWVRPSRRGSGQMRLALLGGLRNSPHPKTAPSFSQCGAPPDHGAGVSESSRREFLVSGIFWRGADPSPHHTVGPWSRGWTTRTGAVPAPYRFFTPARGPRAVRVVRAGRYGRYGAYHTYRTPYRTPYRGSRRRCRSRVRLLTELFSLLVVWEPVWGRHRRIG